MTYSQYLKQFEGTYGIFLPAIGGSLHFQANNSSRDVKLAAVHTDFVIVEIQGGMFSSATQKAIPLALFCFEQ